MLISFFILQEAFPEISFWKKLTLQWFQTWLQVFSTFSSCLCVQMKMWCYWCFKAFEDFWKQKQSLHLSLAMCPATQPLSSRKRAIDTVPTLFWLTGYSSGRHWSPGSHASSKDILKPGCLRASPSYRLTSVMNSLLSKSFVCRHSSRHDIVSYIGKLGQGNSSREKQIVAAFVRTASENTHLSNNVFGLYFTWWSICNKEPLKVRVYWTAKRKCC